MWPRRKESPSYRLRVPVAGLRSAPPFLVAALVLALVVAGVCGMTGCILPLKHGAGADAGNGARGNGNGAHGGEAPAEAPRLEVSVGDCAPCRPEPEWTKEYDRPVTAALSSDGKYLLVGRSFGSVRNTTQWSAMAYSADGNEIWHKSYDRSRYRTIKVDVVGPQPVFAVSLFTWSNSGNLFVYDVDGNELWSRTASCSVCLTANGDGSRVFGIDRGRRELFLAETATGRELATVKVSQEASLQADALGNALIVDPESITLVSPAGKVQGRVDMSPGFTSVELGPNGETVYVSTRGAESKVFRFGASGKVLWQTEIPVGGSNCLAVSSDGRFVVAYNAGIDNGFILLDAADGRILRSTAFAPIAGVESQFIKWVRFLPEDKGLLIDYAVARDLASGHIEEHSLLWFDGAGVYRTSCQFGPNADILVSMDGASCVVVNTMPLDYDAPSTNKVQFFDIRGLCAR